MRTRHFPFALATLVTLFVALFTLPALAAAGSVKFKSTDVSETSGAWHLFVKIELPKVPLTAHQSMKFVLTKTSEYERSLVDGHKDPVLTRTALSGQTPTIESLDVDFADPSGKIFKGTNFDFGLTRARGYVAGEYKVEVRSSDGSTIGSAQNLVLKGDNDVVDRRAMTFNANSKSIKKVEGYDGGAVAQNDVGPAANNLGNGEVTPTGTAEPFIPKEGYNETEEEKIKTRPKGCGCNVPGIANGEYVFSFLPLAGLAVAIRRRTRKTG